MFENRDPNLNILPIEFSERCLSLEGPVSDEKVLDLLIFSTNTGCLYTTALCTLALFLLFLKSKLYMLLPGVFCPLKMVIGY